jgi:hypothetical protein
MGGKANVAAISSKEQLELDVLPILETGRMLDFIEVKSGDVSITEKDAFIPLPVQVIFWF